MPLTEKKLLRETWCSTSLRIFKGSTLDAEILLENYAVTKYGKIWLYEALMNLVERTNQKRTYT